MTKQFRRRRADMRPLLIYLSIVECIVRMCVCRIEKQRWKKMQQQQRRNKEFIPHQIPKYCVPSHRLSFHSNIHFTWLSLSHSVWKISLTFCFRTFVFFCHRWHGLRLCLSRTNLFPFFVLFSPVRAIKFNLFNVCVSFIFEEFGRFVVHFIRKEWEHISRPNNIIIISFSNIWLDSHALLKCEVNWNRYLNTRNNK